MKFYEKIGNEIPEKFAELEVAEWENDEIPNCILIQGTWETSNGDFLIECEWLTDEHRISWLRVSEITNFGDIHIFDSDVLADFQNRYPLCWNELTTFAEEIR